MSRWTQWSLALLILFNAVLTVAVVNLGAFASKGPRYTADDGRAEREQRIAMDLALSARIDKVHKLLAERDAP